MTVDYAKRRVQFGRAIAAFQAVQHACADMTIAIDSARLAVYEAITRIEDGETGGQGNLASQDPNQPRLQVDDPHRPANPRRHRIHGGIRPPAVDARAKAAEMKYGASRDTSSASPKAWGWREDAAAANSLSHDGRALGVLI